MNFRNIVPGVAMKHITKANLRETVAARFKEHYTLADGTWDHEQWSRAIYNRLIKLPPDAPEDDITEIIGNYSWTRLWCDQCRRDVAEVVDFDFEIGEQAVRLCGACLDQARGLLR